MNRALKNLSVNIEIPAHFHRVEGSNDECILVLHGYGQTVETFSPQIETSLQGFSYIILQAPFPVPVRTPNRMVIGYGWYAFDSVTKIFHIPISSAVSFVTSVLAKENILQKVTRIVGFSQGGYLAPYLGLALPNVKQVVGIHCRFREEDLLDQPISFRMDAIHGAGDEIVDPILSQQCHQKLVDRGVKGEFVMISAVGHSLTNEVGAAVTNFLKK